MEYYSAIKKDTFESVLMRWMKLEPTRTETLAQGCILSMPTTGQFSPLLGNVKGRNFT